MDTGKIMDIVDYTEILDELSKIGCETYDVKFCWIDGCCIIRKCKDDGGGKMDVTVESPTCYHKSPKGSFSPFTVPYPSELTIHQKPSIYVINMHDGSFTYKNPTVEYMELLKKCGLVAIPPKESDIIAEPEIPLK